jgi:transposase-like protein
MKAQNYTPELTASIIEQYEAGVDVSEIAEAIDKSVRSVRSKLVREGVYVAKPKTTSRKKDEPTKKELINHLETIAPFGVDGFMGATKEAINELIKHLEAQ